MFDLATINNDTQKLSSFDYLNNFINPARILMGENPVRNNDFIKRVQAECDDLGVMRRFRMTTTQGAPREVMGYELNKDQLMIVGMRESKAVRKAVLEKLKLAFKPKEQAPAIPQSFSEALLLAAKQAEQIERDAPKVAFAEKVREAKNGISIGMFAKAIGIGRNQLFSHLRLMGVLIGHGKEYNNPYQRYINSGYFEVQQSTYEYQGQTVVANTTLVTGKGEIWLTKQLKKAALIQ
ncbi:phage antirepressor KilAC domain-containing protein [Photobacterium leiognathi]|uniref:phage antirepressor KilAC domain-containing protein n=1 Tax=Photobacterium leiognathi TaxID=553611 RepID=UPI001EE14FCF|nr:phage antirepressor KilAC domain-containing protein [Photobacterium leiognathi]MCG3884153.1 phage antirepressor KilAC domain-containing protein [Photobacterium leiognathi]